MDSPQMMLVVIQLSRLHIVVHHLAIGTMFTHLMFMHANSYQLDRHHKKKVYASEFVLRKNSIVWHV